MELKGAECADQADGQGQRWADTDLINSLAIASAWFILEMAKHAEF